MDPMTRKAYLLRKGNVVLVGPDKRRLVVDELLNINDLVRVTGHWADNTGPDADFLNRMGNTVELTVEAFSAVEVEA